MDPRLRADFKGPEDLAINPLPVTICPSLIRLWCKSVPARRVHWFLES
jgi:hypothetical protein